MASFWRRYGVIIVALAGIAAVSAGGLCLRGRALDVQVFRAINAGLNGAVLDALGAAGFVVGSVWFSLGLFAVLFFVGCRRFALSAVGATLAGGLLVLLIKFLAQTPRPWQELAGVRFAGIREQGPGFPSGHAFQAYLTAYLLASYFPLHWYGEATLYLIAAFIGLTRIYVGDHLPADVLAGSLIGFLFGVLWVHSPLWPRGRARPGREGLRC